MNMSKIAPVPAGEIAAPDEAVPAPTDSEKLMNVMFGAWELLDEVRRKRDHHRGLAEQGADAAAHSMAANALTQVCELVTALINDYALQGPTLLPPAPAVAEGASAALAQDRPLSTVERNILLVMIAAACKEASLDYTKPAKTAGVIIGLAAQLGAIIGETTVEGHLKRIPQAIEARTTR
jgi:hypothetical protein